MKCHQILFNAILVLSCRLIIAFADACYDYFQGRIISVCDDGEQNTIHLWEVNKKEGKSVLEEVKTCTLEGR